MKKPSYFPLHWLFNRDPYNILAKSPQNWEAFHPQQIPLKQPGSFHRGLVDMYIYCIYIYIYTYTYSFSWRDILTARNFFPPGKNMGNSFTRFPVSKILGLKKSLGLSENSSRNSGACFKGRFQLNSIWKLMMKCCPLGGETSNIFYFHTYLGKMPILTNIFQMGWFNHQPVMCAIGSKPPIISIW